MKREGHQHGMVRSYMILPTPPLNPRLNSRTINQFDSQPTAGLFTKVTTKPTNHSKFTGKCTKSNCSNCRVHPVCKSKDKTKGTQKLKSTDIGLNHRLISWKVVDKKGHQSMSFRGISATAILGQLSNDYWDDQVDDEDDETGEVLADGDEPSSSSRTTEIEYEDEDHMSFCDVGFVIDESIDEDWCLIEEMIGSI